MEYITIKEATDKWNISERRIQILCYDNRIDGVRKYGRDWAIPENAQKPTDGRVTSGKYRYLRKKSSDKET